MKLKLFLLVGILYVGTTLQAQQKDIKLENVVNEQFGTLLESLLVNGKIDETNAKTYLETVFGYDETVNNYIQGLNLSQQLQNIGKGNLSLDKYVESLGSNLFNLIPSNYQQQLLKNPNYIGWRLGHEMNNGGISAETMGNAIDLLAENYAQNQKNKLIIEKLKQITPQINSLKTTANNKKTVINDSNNVDNWKLNPVKIKKGFFSNQFTYNKVTIEGKNLILETNDVEDKFLNVYKNKERFDFSKDFKITIKGKLNPDFFEHKKESYQTSIFSILIGQYYLLEAVVSYGKKNKENIEPSMFTVKIPNVEFTTNYGVFNFERMPYTSNNERSKTILSHLNKAWAKYGATENSMLNFNNGFEMIIQNKAGILNYFINGIDSGIQKQITYMPNKFSFDIKATYGKTIIESVKLEHL